jgi:hypothetical protein
MKQSSLPDRRTFCRTLSLSGLLYAGIHGVMPADVFSADKKARTKHWDVIVVGGGPGGVPAAIAATRNGARVLLIERYGFLGGMATAALVLPYMRYNAAETVIVRGLFKEFLDKLAGIGAVLKDRQTFDDERMKGLLDRFVTENKVDLLLHSMAIGVLKEGKKIKAVRVFHKGGMEDLSADVFIDSTGDGDISTWAGARVEVGRDSDHSCQPMTMCFRMARVATGFIPDSSEINRLYDAAKARGEVKNPRENLLKFRTIHPDVVHFNTTRVIGETSLDGWSMTRAEIEGRRQVEDMVSFLQKHVNGFENSYLVKMAAQIGVR